MTDINPILLRYLSRLFFRFKRADKEYLIDYLLNEISKSVTCYKKSQDINFNKFYHKFKLGEDVFKELEDDNYFKKFNPKNFPELFIEKINDSLSDLNEEEEDVPSFEDIQLNYLYRDSLKNGIKRLSKKYILLVELQTKLSEIKSDKLILDSTENDNELNSKVNKLKKEFQNFDFYDVTKYKNLTDKQKNSFLKKLIVSEKELKVALLYKLGFTVSKVEKKEKIYTLFSKILDIKYDTLKKLVLVTNPNSTVNKKDYRTNDFFQDADNFIESLK